MTAPGPVTLPAANSTTWYSHYTRTDELSRASAVGNANRVAFLGDSITALNGTGDNVTSGENVSDNYSGFLPVLSNGRIQYARSFATGGLGLSELRDTVLPRLLARPTAERPGTCVILGGTNDAGQASGTFSATGSMNALTDIINSLRNAEIRPVLCTLPPRGDSGTANQNANNLNARIAGLARKIGAPLLNFHEVLVNASTGGYASGYDSGDGVHPSPAGMMAMAQSAIDNGFVSSLPPWGANLIRTTADPVDIGGGLGLFLSDSNADGLANGWFTFNAGGTTTVTTSLVTPTVGDGCLGQWQRITRGTPGEAGTAFYQINLSSSGVASTGDLLSLSFRVRWAGLSGAYTTGGTTSPRIALNLRDSGGNSLDVMQFASTRDITGVVHLERRVPASTSQILIDAAFPGPSTGSATFDIGQATIRNLTTLGLA